jgi:predicted methyltransferase
MLRAPNGFIGLMRALVGLTLVVGLAGCSKDEPRKAAAPASSDAGVVAASARPAAPDGTAPIADVYQSIVDQDGRTADDRNQDGSRKPADFLRFASVKPGMKVADLAAGGGYTTELLVRAVGATGKVWAQNPSFVREKFVSKTWPERLARPVNKGVVRVDREMQDPLPKDAVDLDLVVMAFFYHDTVWLKTNRDAMNKKVFAALRPGGVYLIADHAARADAGTTVAETLHRIEKKVVIDEVTRAGFKLETESPIYANPQDTHDWNIFGEGRGTTDRFVLRFVKPVAP